MERNVYIMKSQNAVSIRASTKPDVNLVLCGSDATLKASVSKCFSGEKTFFPSYHHNPIISECVRRDSELHGRLVSLVELPALNQLTEEGVRRQTLNCVSLCDPGVHVFLLIVPAVYLTDGDKAEIEKIQKIFASTQHFVVLFTTVYNVEKFVTDFIKHSPETQSLISRCGGRYRVMGLTEHKNYRQIPELLDYIENMKNEPYSLQMYMKAQENRARCETEKRYEEKLKRIDYELEAKHKEDLRKMENKIKDLHQKHQSEGFSGAKGVADDQEWLRIVLIGRTGSGKSATGNTVLGRNVFLSQLSSDSVTTGCQKGVGEVDGRSVAVVDTPGLFDTTLSNDQAVEEIMKCVSLSAPGPHVFVIVLSLGRFTKEETDTIDLINSIFGPKSAQFSIVLFTGGDNLAGESIEDYVKRSKSAELKKLIRDCGNRFLVFNNREKQDKSQVIQLLSMIEGLKNMNDGQYFTNRMFEAADMSIKKRMDQILKEKEREFHIQRKKLQAKHEMEMKNMKQQLEEEKQRADEEQKKMQSQLRKERRERELTVRKMEGFQRENRERDSIEQNHEEEMKILKMKHKYDARSEAEEFYKQQIWALVDKLEKQNYQYDLLKDEFETLQYEIKLIKKKYQKKKGCIIM